MKNRVRELRTQRGLPQARLADAMGVSRQTINSIENSRYIPSLPLAMSLARYFHTTVEEVFDDEGQLPGGLARAVVHTAVLRLPRTRWLSGSPRSAAWPTWQQSATTVPAGWLASRRHAFGSD
jgi:putative transcriptional regulator